MGSNLLKVYFKIINFKAKCCLLGLLGLCELTNVIRNKQKEVVDRVELT